MKGSKIAPLCVAGRLPLLPFLYIVLFLLLLAQNVSLLLPHRQSEIFGAYKLPAGRGSCPNVGGVFNTVAPDLFAFINTCLSSGSVPAAFKHAVLRPLLKKPHHSAGKF